MAARSLNDIRGYEDQGEVQRHLQVSLDKPCAAAYFAGRVLPTVGLRSQLFFALAAELRRTGTSEDRALELMSDYFKGLPYEVTMAAGMDGRTFTLREVEACTRSAYRGRRVKSSGCNSVLWRDACPGAEHCEFHRLLTKGAGQGRLAAYSAFLPWLGAQDGKGRKLLTEGDVRVYLGVDAIEARRGFKPGTCIYASWREIASTSGIHRHRVGGILQRLFWHGLIKYRPGDNARRGVASEVQRIVPVPQPPRYPEGTG